MAPKRRWMRWILQETATAKPMLPWHRGVRRRRARQQPASPQPARQYLLEQA